MPLLTFDPPVGPSPGTTWKPRFKVLEAEFGDGYSQPTPDGINHIKDELSLGWDGLTKDECAAIYGFLVARRGADPFYFMPAGETVARKWTCKEIDKRLVDGVWKVSAVLIESFTTQS